MAKEMQEHKKPPANDGLLSSSQAKMLGAKHEIGVSEQKAQLRTPILEESMQNTSTSKSRINIKEIILMSIFLVVFVIYIFLRYLFFIFLLLLCHVIYLVKDILFFMLKKTIEILDEIFLSVTAIGICLLLEIILFKKLNIFDWGEFLYNSLNLENNIQLVFVYISAIIILEMITTKIKILNVKTLLSGQRSTLCVGILSGFIYLIILIKKNNLFDGICIEEIRLTNYIYLFYKSNIYISIICIYTSYWGIRIFILLFIFVMSYIKKWLNIIGKTVKEILRKLFYKLKVSLSPIVSFFLYNRFMVKLEILLEIIHKIVVIYIVLSRYGKKGLKKLWEVFYDPFSFETWSYAKDYSERILKEIENEAEEKYIEKPIISQSDDILDYNSYAVHYAQKMLLNNMHTFAILGGYGYGKSSFANLMWNRFHEIDASSIRVSIDTWGIPSNAIMGYILKQIQKELNKYADILRIYDINDKYQKIVFPGSPFLWGMFDFLKAEKSQAELIQDLDHFLISIDRNIFIVIEDFDRLENPVLFANIAAFVDFCKNTKRIYVIISVSDGKLTQLIIRCCVGYHSLSSIAQLSNTNESIQTLIKQIRGYTLRNHNMEIKPEIESKIIDYISRTIETPRELNHIKNIVIMKFSIFSRNFCLWDFLIYYILEMTKEKVTDNECSGFAFLVGQFEEICESAQKFDLNWTFLSDLDKYLVHGIISCQNSDIENFIKKSLCQKKVPILQQSLIILLLILAHNDPKGQHLLNNKYSNYFIYLKTGLYNIKEQNQLLSMKTTKNTQIAMPISDYFITWCLSFIHSFSYQSDVFWRNQLKIFFNIKNIEYKIEQFKECINLEKLHEDIIKDITENKELYLSSNHSIFVFKIYVFFNIMNSLYFYVKEDNELIESKYYNYIDYFNAKIEEQIDKIIKNNENLLLHYKKGAFMSNAGFYNKSKELYIKKLIQVLEAYLLNSKESNVNSKRFIINLPNNKKFFYEVVFCNNENIIKSINDKFNFLGKWFENYSKQYPNILIPQLTYLCSSFTLNKDTNVFWPDKFLAFFKYPQQLMEIYSNSTIVINDKLSIKLQNDARKYLDVWSEIKDERTFNQVFINMLSENIETKKILLNYNYNKEYVHREVLFSEEEQFEENVKRLKEIFNNWDVSI